MANRPKPLLLLIADGFGLRKERDGNAIVRTPTFCRDRPQQNHTMTALERSGDVAGTKRLLDGGNLANPALIMLNILGVQQPSEMTGRSLFGQ